MGADCVLEWSAVRADLREDTLVFGAVSYGGRVCVCFA